MKIGLIRGVVTPLSLFLLAVFASAQKLPLSFEPNQGQTDARVQFVSRGAGYTIFLSPASATFALRRNAEGTSTSDSAVVRMDLSGANAKASMQPEDRLPGVTNYLMGSGLMGSSLMGKSREWPTNLPTYAKARS